MAPIGEIVQDFNKKFERKQVDLAGRHGIVNARRLGESCRSFRQNQSSPLIQRAASSTVIHVEVRSLDPMPPRDARADSRRGLTLAARPTRHC